MSGYDCIHRSADSSPDSAHLDAQFIGSIAVPSILTISFVLAFVRLTTRIASDILNNMTLRLSLNSVASPGSD